MILDSKEFTKEYFKLVPLATKIYISLFGESTGREYFTSFNVRGKIIRELIKHKL